MNTLSPSRLRGHVEAVDVQVRRFVEAVHQPDAEFIARPQAQGGARDGAVVTEGAGLAAAELHPSGGGVKGELQPAVRAAEFGGTAQLGTLHGRCAPAVAAAVAADGGWLLCGSQGPPQPGAARHGGRRAQTAQQSGRRGG